MSDKETSEKLMATILSHLPTNKTSAFAEILLPRSNCLLYMPLRPEQIRNEQKVKELYQDIANKAQL